jgi:alpha-D-ribose 1-methylphosphonate 5-triphosphate synthase subunit PhnG
MTNDEQEAELRLARQRWLAVLAHAPRELLERHAAGLPEDGFTRLRAPEIGLTMVRARIGNQGDRFNVGDATVTRCVVRHRGRDGRLAAGVGYVLGRDEARAEWVARLDALLQQPEHHDALMRDVIAPLAAETARRRAATAALTAGSRVSFDTLASEISQ